MAKSQQFEIVLKPRKGWQSIDFGEIWQYRELLAFLVWRDIKIRYRQTALGIAWAVLQPLAGMVIFTFFFHKMAGIESGSDIPYPLFAYSGLVVWMFFSNAVGQASNSLIGNQQLISKIYFPRAFIPLGSIGALLVDLLLGLLLVGGLFVWYEWPVTIHLVELPIFIVAAFMAASGVGFILSALSVRYRDIKYVVPFLVQMWLFITPVIYPAQLVQRFPALHDFLWLNPMSGIVQGFRHCLLGEAADWSSIALSILVTCALFVGGWYFFRRWEREFSDII